METILHDQNYVIPLIEYKCITIDKPIHLSETSYSGNSLFSPSLTMHTATLLSYRNCINIRFATYTSMSNINIMHRLQFVLCTTNSTPDNFSLKFSGKRLFFHVYNIWRVGEGGVS